MICKNCGSNVAEGFVYCTNCGAQMPTCAPYDEATTQPAKDTYVDTPPKYEVSNQAETDPGKTLGIVSLILGIVSLVTGGFPAASVVGIILGSMGKKKSAAAGFQNGSAKIGTILSIIGLVLFVLAMIGVIIYYIFIIGMAGAMSSSSYYY